MRVFQLGVPLLFLTLSLACKPVEPPAATTRPADAPPSGKELMGGNPTASTPQKGTQPLPFEKAAKVEFAWDGKSSSVVAHLKLEPGFHAYGPGEQTGKPISLEVTGTAWNVKEVQMPPAVKKDMGELGTSFVLTGDIEVSAKLSPAADAKAPIVGKLNYQVCSETACDRPRNAAFNLTPG